MNDLVAFLRARLDEDEAAARAATQGRWHRNSGWTSYHAIDAGEYDTVIGPGDVSCMSYCYGGSSRVEISDEDAEHITRWDPARVLAEVAAKRAVLDDYQIILANNAVERATKPDDVRDAIQGLMVKTLRMVLLRWAQPYAGHPDFDPAWRRVRGRVTVSLGDERLARVDAAAELAGVTRAEILRRIIDAALAGTRT